MQIAKWQQKMETSEKQAKKAQNMINDAQNKIAKNEDLKRDLEAFKEHPEGIYLSGALLIVGLKIILSYMVRLLMNFRFFTKSPYAVYDDEVCT